jgi:hypothetical protein
MNVSKSTKNFSVVLLMVLTSLAQTAQAQDQDFPSEANWQITAYLWFQGIEGTVGIGPIKADIDLSVSDLLSSLNIGGAVSFRRDWGRNIFVADLNYYSLSPDDVDAPLGGKITTDLKQPLYQFYYGRKTAVGNGVAGWLVGARYMEMDVKLTWKPNLPMDPKQIKRASPDFTDFLLGGFYEKPISEKWSFTVQGDFGVGGSDHSWNGQMFFNRKLQSGNAVVLGFRVTDVDFKDKLPNDEIFVYDARMFGLTLGFTWD